MIIDSSVTLGHIIETFHKVPGIPYVDTLFAEHLEWCLDHCKGQFMDVRVQESRTWFFEIESDAIMFALKWGSSDKKGYK